MPTPPRLPPPLRLIDRTRVLVGSRRLSLFAGCDYLGLSTHPAVLRALCAAALQQGAGAGASRVTTGNRPLHVELESALAKFFGVATATLLPTGYLADLAAAQALSNRFTHAFIDERAHSSLRDAARHLGPQTRVQAFRHRNPSDLARRLHRAGPRARPLVMTDGLFAFDGSLAPLREYLDLLPASGRLLVDDAQAAGVLGKQGRGSPEHWRFTARERARVIHVIALSKAFGVGGAAVLGSPDLRHGILQNSPVFSGSTALSPPLAAAALAALQVARADPTRRTRLQEHIARVRAALHGSNQPAAAPSPSPIIALFPRDSRHAAALRKILVKAGIYPSFIHYPGGPSGGFFRLALSSEHRPRQISSLASALSACFPPARGRNSSRSIYTNNSPARGDR